MIAQVVVALSGVSAPLDVWALPVGTAIVVIMCMAFARTKLNRFGMRLLWAMAGVLVVRIIGRLIFTLPEPPVWRLLVVSASFFCLWWLGAPVRFDLRLAPIRPARGRPRQPAGDAAVSVGRVAPRSRASGPNPRYP